MVKVLNSIKQFFIKIKQKVSIRKNKIRVWAKRHKKRIIIPTVILCLIALTVGLVMGAYSGVDLTEQAVIINYTEQKILNGSYSNEVNLIGLNSNYFEVHKRKFLLYFEERPMFDRDYWSPKINARTLEGTKLVVSARVSCQVRVGNLKDFLEEYGLNWRIYPMQKARNVIIQRIAQTKFYELNNSLILSKVNTEFSTNKQMIINYPFNLKLIGLKIQYPANSFSVNNTLGIQLLAEKSMLSQLNSNYKSLNTKFTNFQQELRNLSAKIGAIQGEIRMTQMKLNSLAPNWFASTQSLSNLFGNSTQLRRYLWMYFQKVYNGTYNNFSVY